MFIAKLPARRDCYKSAAKQGMHVCIFTRSRAKTRSLDFANIRCIASFDIVRQFVFSCYLQGVSLRIPPTDLHTYMYLHPSSPFTTAGAIKFTNFNPHGSKRHGFPRDPDSRRFPYSQLIMSVARTLTLLCCVQLRGRRPVSQITFQ